MFLRTSQHVHNEFFPKKYIIGFPVKWDENLFWLTQTPFTQFCERIK